jgi:hypothetical protein
MIQETFDIHIAQIINGFMGGLKYISLKDLVEFTQVLAK